MAVLCSSWLVAWFGGQNDLMPGIHTNQIKSDPGNAAWEKEDRGT